MRGAKHFPSPTVFLCFFPKKEKKKHDSQLLRMQSIKNKLLTSAPARVSEQSAHLWKKEMSACEALA